MPTTKCILPRDPFPPFDEPSLPTLAIKAPSGGGWIHEIKHDGYRARLDVQDGTPRILTRGGHDWTHRYRAVAAALASLPVRSASLDGEVVVLDENGIADFYALAEAGRENEIVAYVFDALYLDGQDLRGEPLWARKDALRILVERLGLPWIRYVDHIGGDGKTVARQACVMGLEGIVSKKLDAPYRHGRHRDWLKVRCRQSGVFLIVGFQASPRDRHGIGSLVLAEGNDGDLRLAGMVGTGFSEAISRGLRSVLETIKASRPAVGNMGAVNAVWTKPLVSVEVDFRGRTSNGLLRHASFRSVAGAGPGEPSSG